MKTTITFINGTSLELYESDGLPDHATILYKVENGDTNITVSNKEGKYLIPVRNILYVTSRKDY